MREKVTANFVTDAKTCLKIFVIIVVNRLSDKNQWIHNDFRFLT
jgi:hypothetical protein